MFKQIYARKYKQLCYDYVTYFTTTAVNNKKLFMQMQRYNFLGDKNLNQDQIEKILGNMKYESCLPKNYFFIYTEYRMGLNMSDENKIILINRPEFYNRSDKIDTTIYPLCKKEKRLLIWYKICPNHQLFNEKWPLDCLKLYEKIFGIIDHPDIYTEGHSCKVLEINHYKRYGILITLV